MSDTPSSDLATLVRIDAGNQPPESSPQEACAGCRELTARVERLEAALAARPLGTGPLTDSTALTTTACYWTCVGVHACVLFLMYAVEPLLQFGLMGTIGAVATLVAVQVLSTRPIHVRTARTLLTTLIVTFAAMLGLWVGQDAEFMEIMPFMLLMYPPVFASGWLVAKLFVWVGGWRVVPPGKSSEYPRLGILHLLLCTLVIALYLGLNRLLIQDISDWIGEDVAGTLAYICIPMALCTVVACVLARILLVESIPKAIVACALLGVGTTITMLAVCILIFALWGEFSFDAEIMLGLLIYSIPLTLGVFASAGGTFSLMRVAKYRFAGRYSPITSDATAN